ncbi:hypothetical protein FisN_7Lh005 [Fistulifera solaris]|uniref:F-box domain-containing protein n=1 Tax=Fistulifera solaris TaxID=1519565 RepID=A0A1Z5JCG4_FISSO|nr:hypothetical protein FisN_7Lh005 [Fistulifera solaris]|eukprot:GAX11646.1 hypothetical protein FisN_7Lh005 [Fistulifera solaris]
MTEDNFSSPCISNGNDSLLSLQDLGEDLLAIVLSYLDLSSAIRWKELINSSWKLRLTLPSLKHVWGNFFRQQGFSLQDFPHDGSVETILQELQYRTLLQKMLWGRHLRRRSTGSSLSFSNRLFSFLPILPDDNAGEPETIWWNDPPPVNFACDSFVLTSTATGSEFLLLNPFTHSLSLYASVLDNAVHSDEGMMEQAMQQAAGCIISQSAGLLYSSDQTFFLSSSLSSSMTSTHSTPLHSPPLSTLIHPLTATTSSNMWTPEQEEDERIELAAVAFEDRVRRNHSLYNSKYHKDPQHVLISHDDPMLDVDWMNYFWTHASRLQQNGHRRFFPMDEQDESGEVQVEIAHIGLDAKPVLLTVDGENESMGSTTMLSVGRALYTERLNHDESMLECFEIMSWFRKENQTLSQWICRVRGDFQWVELCANNKLVYLNPSMPNGDHLIRHWNQPLGNSQVLVYPMVEYSASSQSDSDGIVDPSRYFPAAKFIIECQSRVSALGICASGNYLIVATLPARLMLWSVCTTPATPVLVQEIGLNDVVPFATESPIQSIHPPKSVSIEERGFCTVHKSQIHGSTLLVWHYGIHNETQNRQFQTRTMIHLPLSTQRTPQIHYDGRRLIVFGQDHISLIILVYEIIALIDHPVHQECFTGKQLDGGVFDLSAPGTSPRVRFVNRIRHAALGGIEDYESLKMTCNERYIIVSTKTGNLLSEGAIPFHEGLLVIDLDDYHKRSV